MRPPTSFNDEIWYVPVFVNRMRGNVLCIRPARRTLPGFGLHESMSHIYNNMRFMHWTMLQESDGTDGDIRSRYFDSILNSWSVEWFINMVPLPCVCLLSDEFACFIFARRRPSICRTEICNCLITGHYNDYIKNWEQVKLLMRKWT